MMDRPISIHEMRRRAPLHFEAKASNARFVAYLLSSGISAECLSAAATCSGYEGTPSMAAGEAFDRESAVALELIVKAVIALKIELGISPSGVVRVSAVHDLPRLWREAGLPSLSSEDRRWLLEVKSLLTWKGRYAAPKTDEQFDQEKAAYDALCPRETGLVLVPLAKVAVWDWEKFDRIYQVANRELWQLWPSRSDS
jgi:hypothetical protein